MIGDIHQATSHDIRPISATLSVPRSSYYQAAAPTRSQLSDHETREVIEAVFKRHHRRYDCRRIMTGRGLKALQSKLFNRVRASGIIFIPTSISSIYLAVVIDLCQMNRRLGLGRPHARRTGR